jgi:quinoprotein glucose dehydrogenase
MDARVSRWTILTCVLACPVVMRGHQAASTAGAPQKTVIQLPKAEAERRAAEIRKKVSVDVPKGLELTLWAPDPLVGDPVALDVDANGIAYAISSSRANLPLDIRGHADWVPLVHTLKSAEALREFYRKELAPDRSAKNGWIPDLNKDGSHDDRDLRELQERIVRIQDTDGDGIADTSVIMKSGFNDDPTWDVGGGILHHEGDVIFGMAPGVYRLHDSKDSGRFDRQTTISEGYNTHPAFAGHGISGVMLGPDGRLYWEVGDIGFNVADRSGRRWVYPNQGAVLRSEIDGSGFEVFAAGIRNLQEFSFDEHGNLVSVDNDGDHEGESERVVYIPYGSDSGWRSNWQYGKYTDPRNNRYNVWMDEAMYKPRHDGQAAHIIPPIKSWHAGPSGMVYNPGTALSEEWRNYFFVTSFPGAASNARIYGFKLKESGAGFTYEEEKTLLRGILAIGLRFGPEGALYITDWITGWNSKNSGRLWKLDAPTVAGTGIRTEVQSLLRADFGTRTPALLATLLKHADMRVRQKAQFELVRRADANTLVAAVRDTLNPLARLHGLWGIAQLSRRAPQHASQLAAFLTDSDVEVRAQAAKMIGDVRHVASADRLVPVLKDGSPRVRYFAAEAIARIAHQPAASAIVEMLAANDDQDVYLRHAGSLALSAIGDSAALEALAQHASRGVRIAAVTALRRMRHAGVARFLADRDDFVVTEAARAINDDGSIEAAVPALAALLSDARFTSEPLLRRAINANLRVGSNQAAERVAAFAADAGRPARVRVEAVAALGVWRSPSLLDRVDGIYLEPQQPAPRQDAAARAAVQRLIEALPASTSTPEMRVALAEAAGFLELKEVAPVLFGQLQSDPSVEVRLAALRALQALKAENSDELMKTALADKDPAVRKAALGILPGLAMSSAAKVQQLSGILRNGSLLEQQGAFEVLGTLRTAESRDLLGRSLTDLESGKVDPALQVDVVDAVQVDAFPALIARLDALRKSRSADNMLTVVRSGLLAGGDARRGARVVFDNPAAECTRCHTLRGQGSDVGPNLTKIGGTLTREQLLDAVIDPNARIAPGYGTVSVTLKNGERVAGTLRDDTDTHIALLEGTPPKERRIAKREIAERSNPVSAMPPFGLILKPRDIRDLVEFLSTLK